MSTQKDANTKIVFFELSKANEKIIRKELVNELANELAQEFVATKKLKAAQMRRFYNECKTLERKFTLKVQNKQKDEEKELSFNTILPQIKMLKSKAAYAYSRDLIPNCFKTWLENCVDIINNHKDFEAFLMHFEAIVGFAYGHGLKD